MRVCPVFAPATAVLAALALGPALQLAKAQVPKGWYITAHARTSGFTGGVYLHHPTGAVPFITVTGLPPALTGLTPWSTYGNNGANAVAIMPDGTVVVGHVSGNGRWLDLHHLRITANGTTATATQVQAPIPLGTAANGRRAQLAEIEVIGSSQVVVAVGTLGVGRLGGSGPNAPLGSQYAGIVDLATRAVTPITPSNAISGAANSITSDGTDVWLGMGISRTLYRLPIGGDTAVALATPGQINNLALDGNGDLVCTLGNRHERRNPQTGALIATCTAAGGNAMDIEDATGDLILVNFGRVERMTWCSPPSTITPAIGGNASAIDVSPNPVLYGSPTPAGGPDYRWQVAPNPGGLPTLGNSAFALTVAPTTGSMSPFFIWVASTRRANMPLPQYGVTLLCSLPNMIASGFLPASGTPPTSGTVALPLPATTSLRGLTINMQSGHFQANGTIAASDGVCFTLL